MFATDRKTASGRSARDPATASEEIEGTAPCTAYLAWQVNGASSWFLRSLPCNATSASTRPDKAGGHVPGV